MPDFLFSGYQDEPEAAAQEKYAQTPATLEEHAAGLEFREPTSRIRRRAERSAYDPDDTIWRSFFAGATPEAGLTEADLRAAPSPLISPEETKQFSPDGSALSDKPIPQDLARVLGRQKTEQIAADSAVRRYEAAQSWTTNLGMSMAVDMTDPLKISTMFIPGIGEEAVAARLGLSGFFGRAAARTIAGAAGGVAMQAPITGAQLLVDPDYSIRDALRDTLWDAPIGAAIGANILGLPLEALRWMRGRPATETHAGMSAAVSQMVEGKPVDVGFLPAPSELSEPFVYRPPRAETAIGRAIAPVEGIEITAAPTVEAQARRLRPEVFAEYDPLSARAAELRDRLQNPEAEIDQRLSELRAQRDALPTAIPPGVPPEEVRIQVARATAEHDAISRQISDIETNRGQAVAAAIAQTRAELVAVDQRMRDLAPAVSGALRQAETIRGAVAAGRAVTMGPRRPLPDINEVLHGFADRQRNLAETGYAPGMTAAQLAEAKAAVERAAAIKPPPEAKMPEGWGREPGTFRTEITIGGERRVTEGELPSAAAAREGIPFMITAGQRAELARLGHTAEQIRNMTPVQAQEILHAAAREPAPSPAEIDPQLAAAEQAFATVDQSTMKREDWELLRSTEADLRSAEAREGAYMEAANCLKDAGL